MRTILNIIWGFVVCSLLLGCKTKYIPTYITNDSIKTIIKTETKFVKDTCWLDIPEQRAERTTADSTSYLENDYAISTAHINSDGTLYHDLRLKPQKKPIEFDKPIISTDSTLIKTGNTVITKTVEVEKKLSWFQQTQIYGFYVLLLVIIFWFVLRKLKK
jgi:hypothetical protein